MSAHASFTRRAIAALALALAACDGMPARDASHSTDPVATVEPTATAATTAAPPEIVLEPGTAIWTTSSLAKVAPTDTPGTTRDIRLSMARNESESFQIHVRAGAKALGKIDVRVRSHEKRNTAMAFPAKDLVRISREAYLKIDAPSAPWGRTGMLPDALIPARDELTGEARSAFPLDVPANETRSAWIDLFAPEDMAPGIYAFIAEVFSGEKLLASMTIQVRVRKLTLPSTSALSTAYFMSALGPCIRAFGGYKGCGAWPGANGNPDRGVELSRVATARFFLDRRISIANVVYAGSEREGWPHFDSTYGPLLEGKEKTRLRGAKLTSLQFVGLPEPKLLKRWFEHARDRNFASRLFYYRCDEPPRGCTFAEAAKEGAMVHGAAPEMRWLLTGPADKIGKTPLARDVNVLAANYSVFPAPGEPRRDAYDAFARAKNGALWAYQDCSGHGCGGAAQPKAPVVSLMVDASALQNRVGPWLDFVFGVSGELYHGIDACWTHPCGANDPWTSVFAYGGHGEGTLIYPGLPARIGGTSPTVVSSMRLEHLRDGLEDYEYLRAVAARDMPGAKAIAKRFARGFLDFDDQPTTLEAARTALADRYDELEAAAASK